VFASERSWRWIRFCCLRCKAFSLTCQLTVSAVSHYDVPFAVTESLLCKFPCECLQNKRGRKLPNFTTFHADLQHMCCYSIMQGLLKIQNNRVNLLLLLYMPAIFSAGGTRSSTYQWAGLDAEKYMHTQTFSHSLVY